MFVDILAREAINSLSDAHAQTAERIDDEIHDSDKRSAGTGRAANASSLQGKLFD